MATPQDIQNAFNEQIRQIEQQRAMEQTRRDQANQAAEDLYRRSVGDANHVYDQTGAYVGEQNRAIEDLFKTSIAGNKEANTGLAATLAQLSQQNASGAGNELARLGIQGAGMGSYLQDAGLNESLSAQQSANEQSNLSLSNQGAIEVGKLLSGMNEGQRGSVLGNVLVTRDNTFKTNNDAFQLVQQQLAMAQANAQAKRDQMLAEYAAAQAAARSRSRSSYGRSSGGRRSSGGGGSRTTQGGFSTIGGIINKSMNGSQAERTLSSLALAAAGIGATGPKKSVKKGPKSR